MLSGRRISSAQEARDAARRIHDMGAAAVIITGGHTAEGEGLRAEGSERDVVDLLFDGEAFHEFRTTRVDVARAHGTGCTFASAVTASLALGRSLPDAAGRAQRYVAGAIAHARAVGHGAVQLDHFWGGILKG
ncbi:MAG: bifunctional hydroxymethylpyrimidine kinase/phosphomethylpyrimidine kinase [Acidobacteria bacterium]|nr:bifunctional hydroxymethylpyrimidine kinase/phosphomethylpyrimidine kinase [Acidobacteriota bacterium]